MGPAIRAALELLTIWVVGMVLTVGVISAMALVYGWMTGRL